MLHNAKGELLTIEFLEFEAMFERITVPYTDNLRRIGVDASFRLIDPAQYERRVKSFDFDVTTQRYSLRLTPGVELRSYWGSEAAKIDGSLNLAGISDPVVDALIDKAMAAKSRAELVTAMRAADRVLGLGITGCLSGIRHPTRSLTGTNSRALPCSPSMMPACSIRGGSICRKP